MKSDATVETSGRKQARDEVAGHGGSFKRERQAAEAKRCDERENRAGCDSDREGDRKPQRR